jgi:hypothetical protein
MKIYQVFFIILRILVILQVILVLLKKNIINPDIKIIIDAILKLGIGGFLYIFFFFNTGHSVEYWDAYILQFAGLVIILDIDYKKVLNAISKLSPTLYKKLSFLEAIEGANHD